MLCTRYSRGLNFYVSHFPRCNGHVVHSEFGRYASGKQVWARMHVLPRVAALCIAPAPRHRSAPHLILPHPILLHPTLPLPTPSYLITSCSPYPIPFHPILSHHILPTLPSRSTPSLPIPPHIRATGRSHRERAWKYCSRTSSGNLGPGSP